MERTQRWWAATSRADFLTGDALHLSDSPNPEDWGLMYRWHMLKQASAPLLLGSLMSAVIVLMVILPGAHIIASSVTKPVLAVLGAVVLTVGGYVFYRSRRKPYSIITVRVSDPHALAEQLEELWPHLDHRAQQDLRRRFIMTYESQKTWTPEALQQELETQVETLRSRNHAAPHGN